MESKENQKITPDPELAYKPKNGFTMKKHPY